MFNWLKKRLAAEAPEPQWVVMERMDPWLSFERFQALNLSDRQRPTVKGLIDGTIKPAELDAVRRWKARHGEDDDGIDALVFALNHVLEGNKVTYLFEDGVPVPVARFPKFLGNDNLTVLFNDREHHLQIVSLDEFVASNNIEHYTLESLNLSQLRNRITGGAHSRSADRNSSQGRLSVTIERRARSDERLNEAVRAADIAAALTRSGHQASADAVCLEKQIEKLGLHEVSVQLDDATQSTCYVWVVPLADVEERES